MSFRIVGKLFFYLVVVFTATPIYALDKVTLQLKWKHAFQFAGYYMAKEKGYFREAGLDVNFVEADSHKDLIQTVLSGNAQFGVGSSSLLLNRARGEPVVALAVIFQQSPYAIFAAPDIQSVHDLVGKRIMLEPQSDELLAYLKKEGISPESIHQIPHSYDVEGLMSGKADAISGYSSNEPFFFKKARYPFQTFSPRSAGIDFYGDNLFTSEQELRAHPERVKAFRAASLRGWQYVKTHRDEIIDLILTKYAPHLSREYLNFEADQMIPLLQPNLIEIGYMNPHRWNDISHTYAYMGLVPQDFSLDGFLYDATEPDYQKFYIGFAILLALIGVVISIAIYIIRTNVKLREGEEKFRLLTENAKEVIWILCPRTLNFLYVSPAVYNLRGYTPDEIMAKPMDAALTPEGSAYVRAAILQDLDDIKSGKRRLDIFRTDELEQPCKDGSTIWTEVTTNYFLNKKTNQLELRGVTRDITKRKQIEKELMQSETKFRSLFESTSDAVQLLDEKGFFDCNSATLALFGCTDSQQFCSLHPGDLSPTKQPNGEDSIALANQHIATAMRDGSVNFEWTHKRIDTGEPFSAEVLLSSLTLHGKLAIQATVRDITKRKQIEEQVRQLAFYDTLTSLPNRRLLNDRLTRVMAASKRSNLCGAVMFLDLDNFKPLNDTHGHVVGDLLLVEAAKRLKNCVREIDTVARFGGDEFVVMLSELNVNKTLSTDQARFVAEKILAALSAPYLLTVNSDGQPAETVEHQCTASIGVAMFVASNDSEIEIMKHADDAMYQAKDAGRNSIRFYES